MKVHESDSLSCRETLTKTEPYVAIGLPLAANRSWEGLCCLLWKSEAGKMETAEPVSIKNLVPDTRSKRCNRRAVLGQDADFVAGGLLCSCVVWAEMDVFLVFGGEG